jgi:hypothetical protein
VHDNDTVTIVATDVAGNETEQPITVSVKTIGLSTSIVWSGIGDDHWFSLRFINIPLSVDVVGLTVDAVGLSVAVNAIDMKMDKQ